MSDISEDFAAMKRERQEKRSDNRRKSAEYLAREGIAFESKNEGAHLVLNVGGKAIDFWPGTGLWGVRGEKAKQRGVRDLVSFVVRQRAYSL